MKNNDNIPQFVNSDSFMADKNYVKWLSDLKKRFRMSQLKAAVKVNTEMLKFYWSLGEDICEKQKQYKWGANFMKRLSLDLRAEFPQAEGFSWSNLYKIRKWYLSLQEWVVEREQVQLPLLLKWPKKWEF